MDDVDFLKFIGGDRKARPLYLSTSGLVSKVQEFKLMGIETKTFFVDVQLGTQYFGSCRTIVLSRIIKSRDFIQQGVNGG